MWPAVLGSQGPQTHPPGPAHPHPWGTAGARGCYLLESSPQPGLPISRVLEPWKSPWMSLGWLGHSPALKLLTSFPVPGPRRWWLQPQHLSWVMPKLWLLPSLPPLTWAHSSGSAEGFSQLLPGSPTSPPQGKAAQPWWVKAQLSLYWLWAQVFGGGFTARKAEA